MGKLIVLVGPKDSGKKAWAETWAVAHTKEEKPRVIADSVDHAAYILTEHPEADVCLDASLLEDAPASEVEIFHFA